MIFIIEIIYKLRVHEALLCKTTYTIGYVTILTRTYLKVISLPSGDYACGGYGIYYDIIFIVH